MSSDVFVPPEGQDESIHRMAEAANYNAWLLERAARYPARRLLDLGAGIGTFTAELAADEIVAVEPDPAFATILRGRFEGRPDVRIVEGDLFAPEIDGSFEVVISLNVLEHIADDVATLRRIGDLLTPGGHLLLIVPAHPLLFGQIDRNVGHERRYTKRLLSTRLATAGLECEEVRYVNPVGAAGWLVASRILRRSHVPTGPLELYDRFVPVLRVLDRLALPFGLSVWAVARKPT